MRTDFVPPYSVTGKSVTGVVRLFKWFANRDGWGIDHTVIDLHGISSRNHTLIVIAKGELAEGWKTSSSHPILKLFIF